MMKWKVDSVLSRISPVKKALIVIGSLSIPFLIFSLLIAFIVIYKHVKAINKESENKSSQFRQYLQFDPITNKSTFGHVSLLNDLDEDDVSYSSNSGKNYVLISKYGTEEYQCTGSCFCENDESRRNSYTTPVLLKRGIFVLVAGITSIVAYSKAKEYFKNECIRQFSESCSTVISSEIDNCEEIIEKNTMTMSSGMKPRSPTSSKSFLDASTTTSSSPETRIRKKGSVEKRTYSCIGGCLTKTKFNREETNKMALDFHCDKLRKEGVVDVTLPVSRKFDFFNTAKEMFIDGPLRVFCMEGSRDKYYNPKRRSRRVVVVSLCTSSVDAPTLAGRNPTVKCRHQKNIPDEEEKKEELL